MTEPHRGYFLMIIKQDPVNIHPGVSGGAMNRAGLEEYTTHDLRHTAASRLAMAGVSLLKISQILGHSKTEMTARYAHLQQHIEMLQEQLTVARDKMRELKGDPKPTSKI